MQVKKYIVGDMQQAVSMIKEDLGNDAVLLSQKKVKKKGIKGYFSKPVFEVIAAVEEKNSTASFNDELSIKKLEYKINQLQDMMANDIKNDNKHNESNIYIRRLKENDISDKIINSLNKDLTYDTSEEYFNKISRKMVTKLGQPDLIDIGMGEKPATILFIGPTGVGKTTTIAKLATDLVFNQKYRVALATMDTYRVAAVDQLKKYGNILGLSTSVINSPLEYSSVIRALNNYDIILIDTAGRNHKEEYQVNEIKSLLKMARVSKVYLVLSLTSKDRDLIDIINRYSFINNFTLLFTKSDETTSIGNIINVCYTTNKRVSYVTTGQRVPDDIMVFDPVQYVNDILKT